MPPGRSFPLIISPPCSSMPTGIELFQSHFKQTRIMSTKTIAWSFSIPTCVDEKDLSPVFCVVLVRLVPWREVQRGVLVIEPARYLKMLFAKFDHSRDKMLIMLCEVWKGYHSICSSWICRQLPHWNLGRWLAVWTGHNCQYLKVDQVSHWSFKFLPLKYVRR